MEVSTSFIQAAFAAFVFSCQGHFKVAYIAITVERLRLEVPRSLMDPGLPVAQKGSPEGRIFLIYLGISGATVCDFLFFHSAEKECRYSLISIPLHLSYCCARAACSPSLHRWAFCLKRVSLGQKYRVLYHRPYHGATTCIWENAPLLYRWRRRMEECKIQDWKEIIPANIARCFVLFCFL